MGIFAAIAIAVTVWWLFDILTAGSGALTPMTPKQRQRLGLAPVSPAFPGQEQLSRRQRAYGEKLWKAHEAARHR